MLPPCRDAIVLLWRQDDAASINAGFVDGEVQWIWTGSEVLRPHAGALQHHMDRARGDRGDEREGGDKGDINQLFLIYDAVATGTPKAATMSRPSSSLAGAVSRVE